MFRKSLQVVLLVSLVVFSTATVAQAEEGRPGVDVRVAGVITQLDLPGNTFTLRTAAGGDIHIHVTGATEFRSPDGSIAGIDDLEAGMRALVHGSERAEGTIQATVVTVATGGKLPETARILGVISGISLAVSSFGLETKDGRAFEFTVIDRTRFRSRDGSVSSLADLEAGLGALVVAAETDQKGWVALLVAVGSLDEIREHGFRVSGEITKVNPGQGTFSLTSSEGQEYAFDIVERTQFRSPDGTVTSIHDLKSGMRALVAGVKTDKGATIALMVAAGTPGDRPDRPQLDARAAGKIVSLGNRTITLETQSGERQTFTVDESTQYRSRQGEVGGFGDLQVGMLALIVGTQQEDGGQLARVVAAGHPPQGRPRPESRPEGAPGEARPPAEGEVILPGA
jgi:hypothetical protein